MIDEKWRQNIEELQQTVAIKLNNKIICIWGDTNVRVGNMVIKLKWFNEDDINENGERLINFCSRDEFVVNNSFFKLKNQ